MFIIVWALVIAVCAYAGSAVASLSVPRSPGLQSSCTEVADGMGLFLAPSSSKGIPAVTTFSNGLSGITAFALSRLPWRRWLCLSDGT
jgi:hypothetical protein